MKVTKSKLKQIIKEEVINILNEDREEMAINMCMQGDKSRRQLCVNKVARQFEKSPEERRLNAAERKILATKAGEAAIKKAWNYAESQEVDPQAMTDVQSARPGVAGETADELATSELARAAGVSEEDLLAILKKKQDEGEKAHLEAASFYR